MTDHAEQWLVLGVNPQQWRVGPVGTRRVGGAVRGFVGQDAQLAAFKEAVAEEARSKNPVMFSGACDVTIYFWRRLENYVTPMGRKHTKHQVDATNMLKATEDALQGIVFDNDRDNHKVTSIIVEQSTETMPCIVVHIKKYYGLDPDRIPGWIWNEIDRIQAAYGLQAAQENDNVWRGPNG